MIARNIMIMLTVTATLASTGCCNMKDFFFGRGARCGLCNTLGSIGSGIGSCSLNPLGRCGSGAPTCNTPVYPQPVPTYTPTYQAAPTYAPTYQPAPSYQPSPVVTAPPCQSAPVCQSPTYVNPAPTCSSCNSGYATATPGDCGCGSVSSGYAPTYHDPYQNSVDLSPTFMGEHVIGDVVIDSYPGSIGSGLSTSTGDGFTTRSNSVPMYESPTLAAPSHMTDQYDSQGDRILHREPVN